MTAAPFVVRRGSNADLPAVGDLMADAFADYPWTRWTVAADRHHERIAALQQLVISEVVLPFGELWVADQDGRVIAAAAWMRPDIHVPQYIWRDVEHQSMELAGDRAEQFHSAEALAATLRPEQPHWFLGGVGVRPAAQGAGAGSAVLEPVLRAADAAAQLLYLETSTAANVRFYRRRGFAVTGQLEVPNGGPAVWAMSRTEGRAAP